MVWIGAVWIALSVPVALFLGALTSAGRPEASRLVLVEDSEPVAGASYGDERPRLRPPNVPLSANVRIFASRAASGPEA